MLKLASSRRVERVAVPIDRGGTGLDRISEAMFGLRQGEKGSFTSVMTGPYAFPTSCHSPRDVIDGGPLLLDAIARALAPSYAALRDQFGIVYESEAALARAANSRHASICTTYGLFARNVTQGGWQTLHPHSSGTTNLPGGDERALCCENQDEEELWCSGLQCENHTVSSLARLQARNDSSRGNRSGLFAHAKQRTAQLNTLVPRDGRG